VYNKMTAQFCHVGQHTMQQQPQGLQDVCDQYSSETGHWTVPNLDTMCFHAPAPAANEASQVAKIAFSNLAGRRMRGSLRARLSARPSPARMGACVRVLVALLLLCVTFQQQGPTAMAGPLGGKKSWAKRPLQKSRLRSGAARMQKVSRSTKKRKGAAARRPQEGWSSRAGAGEQASGAGERASPAAPAEAWLPLPFFHASSMVPTSDSITLVTATALTTPAALSRFRALVAAWPGPVSVALHAPARASPAFNRLHDAVRGMHHVDVHVMSSMGVAEGTTPVSKLFDMAATHARTQHVYVTHAFMVPSPQLYARLHEWLVVRAAQQMANVALVVPAFRAADGHPLPRSKPELARLLAAGGVALDTRSPVWLNHWLSASTLQPLYEGEVAGVALRSPVPSVSLSATSEARPYGQAEPGVRLLVEAPSRLARRCGEQGKETLVVPDAWMMVMDTLNSAEGLDTATAVAASTHTAQTDATAVPLPAGEGAVPTSSGLALAAEFTSGIFERHMPTPLPAKYSFPGVSAVRSEEIMHALFGGGRGVGSRRVSPLPSWQPSSTHRPEKHRLQVAAVPLSWKQQPDLLTGGRSHPPHAGVGPGKVAQLWAHWSLLTMPFSEWPSIA